MAKAVGLAPSSIQRIWQAFGLQPHRSETSKLSTDPLFVEKVRDIVGLYMAPPDRALVLCVDEKSQNAGHPRPHPASSADAAGPARAPGARLHPRLGPRPCSQRWTSRQVPLIGRCYPKHCSSEFRKFRGPGSRATCRLDLDVHLLKDNYATHKTKPVRDWLGQAPALARSFNADRCLLDQSGRALLRHADGEADQTWRPPLHPPAGERHPSLHRRSQRAIPNLAAGPSTPATSSPPSSASANGPRRSEGFANRDTRACSAWLNTL